jgi:predicted branched-subunit amino acid permease
MTSLTVTATPADVAVTRRRVLDPAGLRDAFPMVAALAPFAVLIGVTIGSAPGNPAAGLSGSLLVYAGSAQLSAVTLLAHGAAALSVVATVALVNARFLVYGAALAPRFAGQPGWFRWGAAHFIVDPTYALVEARDDLTDPARFRSYWLTINLVIATGWAGLMTVGALAGPVVPDVAAVHFLPTAAFLTMLAPGVTTRPTLVATVAAAGTAAAVPVPGAARVLVGLVAGAVAGLVAEGRSR